MMSASVDLHISRVNELSPDTIELLANDGKVTANRYFLCLASSAIHKRLMENPEITIFDMKNHKKSTIDCLLHGIYSGKTAFNDEVEKEEVMSLAQELDINITETTEMADETPKVPEEQPKNVEPELTRLKDGKVSCDKCFKTFTTLGNATAHYKQIHLTKDKNIDCRFQGCLKKFTCLHYMKIHMLQRHGISAKQIPSNSKTKWSITSITKTKSSNSLTKLIKKAVKKEAPEKVTEQQESIED